MSKAKRNVWVMIKRKDNRVLTKRDVKRFDMLKIMQRGAKRGRDVR